MATDDVLLWSVETLAPKLDVSESELYHLSESDQIPHMHIGKRVLFPDSAIKAWIAEKIDHVHA